MGKGLEKIEKTEMDPPLIRHGRVGSLYKENALTLAYEKRTKGTKYMLQKLRTYRLSHFESILRISKNVHPPVCIFSSDILQTRSDFGKIPHFWSYS